MLAYRCRRSIVFFADFPAVMKNLGHIHDQDHFWSWQYADAYKAGETKRAKTAAVTLDSCCLGATGVSHGDATDTKARPAVMRTDGTSFTERRVDTTAVSKRGPMDT